VALASPDGGHLAAMGPHDQTLALWDVAAGQKVRELTFHSQAEWPSSFEPYAPNRMGVVKLAFSSDGSTLAAHEGERIQVWDVLSGQEKLSMKCGRPERLCLSPDGKSVAWSVGKQLHLQPLDGIARTITGEWRYAAGLSWSPRGDRIALLEHRKLHLIRPDSDEIVTLALPDSNMNCRASALAFSPDGTQLYAGADDTPLCRVLLDDGNKMNRWKRLGWNVASIAVAPGAEWLWLGFGTQDSEWAFPAGRLLRVHVPGNSFEWMSEFGLRLLSPDAQGAKFLEDSPDKWVCSRLNLWTLGRKNPQGASRRQSQTHALLAPTGDRFAYSDMPAGGESECSAKREVSICSLGDAPEATLDVKSAVPYGFSEDARWLLVFDGDAQMFEEGSRCWVRPFKLTRGESYASLAGNSTMTRVAMGCAGSIQMVDPHGDEDIVLWEHQWGTEGQISGTSTSFKAETCVRFLGGDRFVVACYNVDMQRDLVVTLDAATGRQLACIEVKHPHTLELFHLAPRLWFPSATRVVLPVEDGYAVYALETGAEECRIATSPDFLKTGYPVLSADCSLLAVPEPGRVKVFSLPKGELFDELKTETPVTAPISMTWMPRGSRLVTQGPGRSYQVWQVREDGEALPQPVEEKPKKVAVSLVIGVDGGVSYEAAE
jgi:WD40 repeat protein